MVSRSRLKQEAASEPLELRLASSEPPLFLIGCRVGNGRDATRAENRDARARSAEHASGHRGGGQNETVQRARGGTHGELPPGSASGHLFVVDLAVLRRRLLVVRCRGQQKFRAL